MNKNKVINEAKNFLNLFGDGNSIKTKFNNICGKTGQYNVPDELFQKRTARYNRVLFPWQDVKKNNLSLEQLNTIEGGVVVDFCNNDFFDSNNRNNELFNNLVSKLGCDETVSSIISIKTEAGSSSSEVQRECYKKLTNNLEVNYKGEKIILTKDNYKKYAIRKNFNKGKNGSGIGNEKWDGFLYVSIKGGQQDTIETHKGEELTLFNPSCEYASKDVCQDINLVLAYFALLSINNDTLNDTLNKNGIKIDTYNKLIENIISVLKETHYNIKDSSGSLKDFSGTLYDYCSNHYSVKLGNKESKLFDPILVEPIKIENFSTKTRTEHSIDLAHDEAVINNKYYWDSERNCILSPARPTNLSWSFHLSNMMQQNYNLDDYFKEEKKRYKKRQRVISQQKK